jgi:hypothetical protein
MYTAKSRGFKNCVTILNGEKNVKKGKYLGLKAK